MNTASEKLASASRKAADALNDYQQTSDLAKLISALTEASGDLSDGVKALNDAQKKLNDLLQDPDIQDAAKKALEGLGTMNLRDWRKRSPP